MFDHWREAADRAQAINEFEGFCLDQHARIEIQLFEDEWLDDDEPDTDNLELVEVRK